MINKKKGFTLVELLVVIAIIALLLSILMPSLTKVRRQAKSVVCLSNLKQWGVAFSMYTNDNNGKNYCYFPPNLNGPAPDPNWDDNLKRTAIAVLKPYYSDYRLAMCPAAIVNGPGGSYCMKTAPEGCRGLPGGVAIAYGENLWATSPSKDIPGGELAPKNFWNTMGVKGSENIPKFMDAANPYMFPSSEDRPAKDGKIATIFDSPPAPLRYPCLDRHGGGAGYINVLFLDGTARKVGLKQLWKFKWSGIFDTQNDYATGKHAFPGWMRNFKSNLN